MKASEFVTKAKLALGCNTVYGSGAFGASIGNFTSQRNRYYDNNLKRLGQEEANKVLKCASNPPAYAFDCCGLIKAIIWGWHNNAKSVYGGAVYESNGLKDLGAGGGKNDLIYYCTDVSTDFSKIEIGEMLWLDGHVGIYAGNGYAIECTTAWDFNVQKSTVTNIKAIKSGEHGRRWDKHGKLPWVEYESIPEITCPCCGAKFVLSK